MCHTDSRIRSALTLVSAICTAISCIYDFEPDIGQDYEGLVVVDGDIIVGDVTKVRIGSTRPLTSAEDEIIFADSFGGNPTLQSDFNFTVRIEGQDGTALEGFAGSDGLHNINTEGLNPDIRYRMVIESEKYGNWKTPWLEVLRSPEIRDLHAEYSDRWMSVHVSTDAAPSDICYRWSYEEDWQYHTAHIMKHTMYFPSLTTASVDILSSHHYCWANSKSSMIILGDPALSADHAIHDYKLLQVSSGDDKLSDIYACTVTQMAISRDAYEFYEAVRTNSYDVGTFFSPQPSEVHGNIMSMEDTTVMAIGCICATMPVTARMYVRNRETDFYTPNTYSRCPVEKVEWDENRTSRWWTLDGMGYTMYDMDPMTGATYWTFRRCVDCTVSGGHTAYPAWWPEVPEELLW